MEKFKVIVKATIPDAEHQLEATIPAKSMQSALTSVKPIIVQEVKQLKECTKIEIQVVLIDF